MITSKRFLASKRAQKLPKWLKTHSIWTRHPTIDKVFSSIGLKNCREHCSEEIEDFGTPEPTVKKMDIVFSSDGVAGLWDLATMSMRGVMTCRHWKNSHSYNLSDGNHHSFMDEITNPTVGIIYLTDGSMTEYGLSINKRALVRYNYDRVYVSTIYAKTTNTDPNIYHNKEPNEGKIRKIFQEFVDGKLKAFKNR